MLDLHYLKLFHVVADRQNFTKASEILHMTQPALSIQIKKLEDGLGMKLFDKNKNKIQLNANGMILKKYTDEIFKLIDEATQELMNESQFIQGEIAIGGSNTPGTYILPRIIGLFKSKYPHVKIHLKIGTTEEITYWVSTGAVDFAINGGEMNYSSGIESVKLMEDEIIFITAKDSFLKEKVPIELLEQTNFMIHSVNSALYQVVKDFFNEFNIKNACTMDFNTIEAIKQAVAANLGVTLIPSVAAQLELELGIIKKLPIGGKKRVYPYYLISNKQHYLSPASKKFIEYINNYFK